jgi:hypothetical protein
MKSKIQLNLKNYQKIIILILILVASLIFAFINGSFNIIEGNRYKVKKVDGDKTIADHKAAAKKRSKNDDKASSDENRLYKVDSALNSG